MRTLTIAYHDVTDYPNYSDLTRPGIALYTLTTLDFRRHLEAIQRERVSLSTVDDLRLWSVRTPVLLTFDDGTVDSYAVVADALEEKGWRGHFFVTTDWIGRVGFLDRRMIRELRERGHVIGTHSCSHPARMAQLEWAEMTREWSESCWILSNITGERVMVASVPNGSYSRRVAEAATAAGIEVLFTSEPTTGMEVIGRTLVLGRYSVRRNTPPRLAGAIATGGVWPRWRQSLAWSAKRQVKALAGKSFFRFRRAWISLLAAHSVDQNRSAR